MRTILVAALLLALTALVWLWTEVGAAPGEVHAQALNEDVERASSNTLEGQAAEAANASAQSTREALIFGPTPDELARAAAEKKAREKKVVEGRVVGPDGQGGVTAIAGATVWASTNTDDWMKLPLDVETEGLPARWITLKKVQTDAEGKFAIEGLAPGPLRIAARASGFAPAYLDHLDLPAYEQHSVGDVKLETGVSVKGRVLGSDGEGLPGANVLIALDCVHRANLISLPGRGIPAGTTGADGSFTVDQLAHGPWHLLFEAPGYVLAERDGRIEQAGLTESGLIVRLEKGVEIHGKVVCKDIALPPDLRIGARLQAAKPEAGGPEGEQNAEPSAPKNDVRARFGLVQADGSFVITGLKPFANHRLVASRKTNEDTGWKGFPSIEPQTVMAGARGVELVYKPESVLLMRVVDAITAEPVTELVVAAGIGRERALRDDKGEVVHAFPEGKVRYPELRVPVSGGKPVMLRVSAAGYKDHENKNVGLKAGAELDLGDIRLEKQNVVVVTVLDETTSAPIEGARVLLSAQKTHAELRDMAENPPEARLLGDVAWKVGFTGADGRARLTSIPGKSVGIIASAKGHRASRVEHAMLPDAADHALELKLGRGGTVIAKVTDGAGHPVAGVGVQHRLPRRTADDENIEEPRKSDAEGIVRFEALADGMHAFQVHEERGEVYFWGDERTDNEVSRWVDVGVAAGQTATVEFVAAARGDVTGIVRENGRPVEGAHVKFVPRKDGEPRHGMAYWGGTADPFSTISAGQGAYKIEHLPCGEYTALVMITNRLMASEFRVRVTPETSQHDFDLDLSGIEGRVVDEHGAPLGGLSVNCSRIAAGIDVEPPYSMVVTEDDRGNANVEWQQLSNQTITTDQNGNYRLAGIVNGEAVVVGVNGEWVEYGNSEPITLSPGETRRGVDFKLRLAGKIEIVMGGAPGTRRQEWFRVSVMQAGDDSARIVRQTYVGGWNRKNTVPSLVPGRYKVAVRRNGQENLPPIFETEVEVQVRQIAHVTFDPNR